MEDCVEEEQNKKESMTCELDNNLKVEIICLYEKIPICENNNKEKEELEENDDLKKKKIKLEFSTSYNKKLSFIGEFLNQEIKENGIILQKNFFLKIQKYLIKMHYKLNLSLKINL